MLYTDAGPEPVEQSDIPTENNEADIRHSTHTSQQSVGKSGEFTSLKLLVIRITT